MSLKIKFYTLTLLLHSVLLVAAFYYLDRSSLDTSSSSQSKIVFVVVELFIITSLALFFLLIRRVLAPFEFVDLFSQVLSEQEFTTRFSYTGNRELDNLMTMFNQMLSQLYEERLKLGDRQAMLQQLMDAIPLSIIVFDYNSNISQINPAAEKLFSVSAEQVKNKKLSSIQHPLAALLPQVAMADSKLLTDSAGKRFRCDHNRFRDRGFERHFYIIQELTSELKSSEKNTYDKLIRMMSHEVNNTIAATGSVLRSCLLYSSQIDVNERDDYENAMRLVIQRTDNLNHFMQEYAQVVRLPKPSIENCNLYHLLLSTERLLQSKMLQQDISFHLPQVAAEQLNIKADQHQLEQVMLNIIKNAQESIDCHGEIRIETELSAESVKLKIIDSGAGISDDCRKDLFTPFFTTKSQGQGIGLMLVGEILDAHHFPYSLYNNPDQGACFEIDFPR